MVRRLAALLALALVLVGCASSGDPETLDPSLETSQLGPLPDSVPAEALADGQDPNRVPLFQRNFLEGCLSGGAQNLSDDLDNVERDGLVAVCGCLYTGFAGYYEEVALAELAQEREDFDANSPDGEILVARRTLEGFRKLDDNFRKDDEYLMPDALSGIAADCILSEAGVSE